MPACVHVDDVEAPTPGDTRNVPIVRRTKSATPSRLRKSYKPVLHPCHTPKRLPMHPKTPEEDGTGAVRLKSNLTAR